MNVTFLLQNHFHIIFNLAVLSVRYALYVFDVYIDVFDVSRDCKGNMLDSGKRCNKSIERNFMMNTFLGFFCFNEFPFISLTFFCTIVKREDSLKKTLNFETKLELWEWPEWYDINFLQNGKHRWTFSLLKWFWYSHDYNCLLDQIGKDDIMRANVSEAVEKIPNKDKKYHRKRSLYVIVFIPKAYQ